LVILGNIFAMHRPINVKKEKNEKFIHVFVRGKAINRIIKAGDKNFGGDFRAIVYCA
jgi:hypothetical protein